MPRVPCFPEPSVPDELFGRGESIPSFLARSTLPHAVELRRFLNRNLDALPPEVASALCRSLHKADFRPAHFELVVARTLQLLGARQITYEGELSGGRRPDFEATFDAGALLVDATFPRWDAEIERKFAQNDVLIQIIEEEIPAGWHFSAWGLPRLGPADSKGPFRAAIKAAFSRLPPAIPGSDVRIDTGGPRGYRIRLDLRAGQVQQSPYLGGPAAGAWSDAERRIERALKRKRPQLREGSSPRVLALAGGLSESLWDFDIHLFGRTFERQDAARRVVATGFDPSGLWGRPREGEARIDAVLAFCHMEYTRGDDPVVYVNPRSELALPRALGQLEHRRLTADGIAVTAVVPGVFERLRDT